MPMGSAQGLKRQKTARRSDSEHSQFSGWTACSDVGRNQHGFVAGMTGGGELGKTNAQAPTPFDGAVKRVL